jgi:hypothetical protein
MRIWSARVSLAKRAFGEQTHQNLRNEDANMKPGVALLLGILLVGSVPSAAVAQEKSLRQQLTGTWRLISVDNVAPDGSRRQNFGANPKGVLMLDASGRYAHTQVRADLPKFAANNRLQGTAEENKAVVQGTVATFGTWSVDDTDKTLSLRIDGSMFPNTEGEVSRRPLVLAGNQLTISNPAATAGGSGVSVFKKAE